MSIALKVIQVQENEDSVTVYCGLTFTGSYTQFAAGAGGDNIDFTTIIGAFSPNGRIFMASTPCIYGTITGINGYVFGFQPSLTVLNTNIVTVWTTATTQQGNGAYPAGVTGDAFIVGEFCFQKFVS